MHVHCHGTQCISAYACVCDCRECRGAGAWEARASCRHCGGDIFQSTVLSGDEGPAPWWHSSAHGPRACYNPEP